MKNYLSVLIGKIYSQTLIWELIFIAFTSDRVKLVNLKNIPNEDTCILNYFQYHNTNHMHEKLLKHTNHTTHFMKLT